MTRKRKIISNKKPTKLLFKNSHNTVDTFSKTYSDASPFCTKSLVMQLKKKLPKTRYYEDQGTLKRDLSIETDICILRRYYKKNRNKLLNRGAVSAKSKYSINHTEIDTINEFTRDSSACGDSSELTNKQESQRYNINLTSLVVNNLKKLLNDWIKKYLFENNQTKQKIDSVLDSILHKLDFQRNDSSSCTYTVDVELGDQSSKTDSLSTITKNLKLKPNECVEDKNKHKSSYLTIPLNNKYLQVISTLSIPRKKMKMNKSKSLQKNKKIRHKKIFLSISKSSKYLLRTSSLDFLTVRTKSLTKRCATYERNDREILNRPGNVVTQKSSNNNYTLDDYSISDKTVSPNNIQDIIVRKVNSTKIPSIYKNVYGIIPADVVSYESTNTGSQTFCSNITEDQTINIRLSPNNTIRQSQEIIDEHEQSEQLVTIDFGKQSREISNLDIKLPNKLEAKSKSSKSRKNKTGYRKKKLFNRKLSKYQTYKSIKSKQFTYLFRKANKKTKKEKELLNHFQSILKYLSNYKKDKDIQLHIQIKVCPVDGNEENTIAKSYTNLKDTNITDVYIKEKDMMNIPPLNSQNIISLLDGATSQSKYIVSRETSTDLVKEASEKEPIKLSEKQMDNSKIAQEIGELRVIIKSLETTAEKLISDHICNNSHIINESNGLHNDFPVNINLLHAKERSLIDTAVEKHSKGNQISHDVPKSQIISGFKLRKEPKNKKFSPHLMKKSTSYKFIPSESIMKITDMTSAAQNIITYEKMTDEALTCSLPKSKSLFEIAVGHNKKKLLAFYCDDFVRPDEYVYSVCEHSTPCSSNQPRFPCQWIKPKCVNSKCNNYSSSCNDDTCPGEPEFTCTEFVPEKDDRSLIDDSCSSVCINIDPKTCTQKVTIRNRDGVSFWEGCLYCVLLWIPVMFIFWLFYVYVIKDLIAPQDGLARGRTGTQSQKLTETIRPSHGSIIPSLTLSDLGF